MSFSLRSAPCQGEEGGGRGEGVVPSSFVFHFFLVAGSVGMLYWHDRSERTRRFVVTSCERAIYAVLLAVMATSVGCR